MKNFMLFIIVLFFNNAFQLASQNILREYIVLSDDVNIRDEPGLNSGIIRKTSFPEIFIIYEFSGTGLYKDGVLDKWAKISKEKSEWINYYYIASFPFVVSANDGFNYDTSDYNTLIVNSLYRWNRSGKLHFMVQRNFTGALGYKNMEYTIDVKPIMEGIKITDNAWTRLYNFCSNFQEYVKKIDSKLTGGKIIIENNIILDYGIHVGMDMKDVTDILGSGYDKKENIYCYEAIYHAAYGSRIYFHAINNKVSKIVYEMVK
ncbi:MAG: hypothetical protein FWC19_06165 [Treponema sp.]|nr:hypothetical protein [Treponema sp.]MCL2272370.1 hypothetical protein [Treponema sp.]